MNLDCYFSLKVSRSGVDVMFLVFILAVFLYIQEAVIFL